MRRHVGVAAFMHKTKQEDAAEALGTSLAEVRHKEIETNAAEFKKHLEAFAVKHRAEINKDPEFRLMFSRMARAIGVDPLVSTKGFWGEALGLSTFYTELGVQIVDVCLGLRDRTGGLVSLPELTSRIRVMRGGSAVDAASAATSSKHTRVTEEDVLRALEKLAILGGGYKVVTIGVEKYVVSVPYELNDDQTTILRHCLAGFMRTREREAAALPARSTASEMYGCVTAASVARELGWDEDRCKRALLRLTQEGMAWLDSGHPTFRSEGYRYYFPAINALRREAPA